MKKTEYKTFITVFSFLSALVFFACNSNNTINREELLQTPDLSFYELRGPVRSVAYPTNPDKTENAYTLYFDENGNFVKDSKGQAPITFAKETCNGLVRDKDGYIAENRDVFQYTRYHWKDGRVVAIESSGDGEHTVDSLFYDANGDLVSSKAVTTDCAFNTANHTDCEYTITERDKYGNWTIQKSEIKYSDHYYRGYLTDSAHTASVISYRKIEYYPE